MKRRFVFAHYYAWTWIFAYLGSFWKPESTHNGSFRQIRIRIRIPYSDIRSFWKPESTHLSLRLSASPYIARSCSLLDNPLSPTCVLAIWMAPSRIWVSIRKLYSHIGRSCMFLFIFVGSPQWLPHRLYIPSPLRRLPAPRRVREPTFMCTALNMSTYRSQAPTQRQDACARH